MNGFGKDFEEKTIDGRLFHAATVLGASYFVLGNTFSICCSTEDSSRLVARDVVIVFQPATRQGLYCSYDGDAGKNFGWDEFRPFQITPKEIEKIIVRPEIYTAWLNASDDEDEICNEIETWAEEGIRIESCPEEQKTLFRME